jgi:aryl-alcohol dehydrogenase-like predicted oxidoreductase
MNKIALGTAQFGMDYGINNKRGKIHPDEVFSILDEAARLGIDTLDTAYSYGDSEKIIGDFVRLGKNYFKIVSKMTACTREKTKEVFKESLNRLGVPVLYGYLLHNFEIYKKDEGIWGELEGMKSEGRVKKIGFSLYLPSELEYLLRRNLAIDIIQIPFSVFDQRFEPYLPRMKKRGIEVHARSIFLQGLVFQNPAKLDKYFETISEKVESLNSLSCKLGISIASLCVNFAIANEYIDKAVIGVDGMENLIEIAKISQDRFLSKDIMCDMLNMRIDDENILLPFKWKLSKVKS